MYDRDLRNWEWVYNYETGSATFYIFESPVDMREQIDANSWKELFASAIATFEFTKADLQALSHVMRRKK